jgi:hydantoinase/carbamoylase family amidase
VGDWLAAVNADQAIHNLHELANLTSDSQGAQRVAWTEPWAVARRWLSDQLAALPVQEEFDEAGNQWATLVGDTDRCVMLGGHLDSVPDGGWLDGTLNVVAALAVLRALAGAGTPRLTVRIVNWADEEGRFGHSLLGSSAVAGLVDPARVAEFRDGRGLVLKDALSAHGIDLRRISESRRQIGNAAAYLELHIEQGPVLETVGRPLAAVTGTKGVHRHVVRFVGQTAHAGSTPMDMRQDSMVAASRLVLAVREIARRAAADAVCTVGRITAKPGVETAVPGSCELTLDQRSIDERVLKELLSEAREASEAIASEEKVRVEWEHIFSVEPAMFEPRMVALCDQAVQELCGYSYRMPSGPLHDATAMAHAGVPTGMIFVQSLRGLSHTKDEASLDEHIKLGVHALAKATSLALTTIN